MAKRKAAHKAVIASRQSARYRQVRSKVEKNQRAEASEALYANGPGIKSFTVTRQGNLKTYSIHTGYGYFISSVKRAENLVQVNELVESGITSKEIEPVIEYLGLKVPEIARAAAVSTSTVSRWKANTSIGMAGSNQFFRIDEVIRKGVDLFGGPEEFKGWLHSPNLSLGNKIPAKLITSSIGIDMVEEALDALHYGNVM